MLFIMKNTKNMPKDIVFISHATPEDNKIALLSLLCSKVCLSNNRLCNMELLP